MPFKSKEQERYLQINEPEIYRDWVEKYGHFKGAESFEDFKRILVGDGWFRGDNLVFFDPKAMMSDINNLFLETSSR